MNQRNGNAIVPANIDDVYRQIRECSDRTTKVGLDLADAADGAAEQMVADCEQLMRAVKDGTDRMRNELRVQMLEFANVMQEYSQAIAAKNAAYVEASERAMETMKTNTEMVRKALEAVAPETEPLELPRMLLGNVEKAISE